MQQGWYRQVGSVGLFEQDQTTLRRDYTKNWPECLTSEEITMRSSKIMMGRMRMVTVAAVLVVASGIGVADAQQGMPGMKA
jgi:hypothetical protein